MIGRYGMDDHAAEVVGPAGLQQAPLLGRHACPLEALHASDRPGETALGVPAGNDRNGVGVEVIGVLVGQDHKVGADFLGRDRRQRQPLEAVQPLDGVGEVRIGVDDLAGGRLEGKARLPQPP